MRFIYMAALGLSFAAAATSKAFAQPAMISADAIREDVRVLSSDAFQGRGPGERGESTTLAFLRGQFEAAGLAPRGVFALPVDWMRSYQPGAATPMPAPTAAPQELQPQAPAGPSVDRPAPLNPPT